MLAYEFIVKCKDHYYHLLNRYCKEASAKVEPEVITAYICGEKQMVFCHPEDAGIIDLCDFQHAYYVL